MKKDSNYLSILGKSPLFKGIRDDEIEEMMGCLAGDLKKYRKDEYILRLGDSLEAIGLLISGSVSVIKEDYWGNRNIMAKMEPGDIFGESYACVSGAALGVSVEAATDSEVLFLNVGKIMTTCNSACSFHSKLSQNLLTILASKNLYLNSKLTHMMQRTTREKLLSYLSGESVKHNSASFDIPFNRQQLADYLSVDRSAMSNELCKMRDEGILKFDKNHFSLMADIDR
jgi:cAMP-binding proteins - catabolite gene activator and regulatory subunit of cAMP-dependent protein kinases